MKNLTLIDHPYTIAGVEMYDVMIALIPSIIIGILLAMISVILFTVFPFITIGIVVKLKEKKRDRHYGYFQRAVARFTAKWMTHRDKYYVQG